MKIVYDYHDLLYELHTDLRCDYLTTDSTIQVLRGDPLPGSGYRPIIDWYYDHETMKEDCRILPDDTKIERKSKEMLWADYAHHLPDLQPLSLELVLQELNENNID